MPAEETLRITLQADLRDLQKSLAQLPEISEREAKLMVAGLNRQLKLAENAAKRAASECDKAWKSAGQGLKSALSSVGGVAGQVGGILFEVGEKITTAGAGIGALGGLAAGAVVSIAALGVAAKGLADSALEVETRWKAAGLAAMIPPEATASLEEYKRSTADLKIEVDKVKLSLGSLAAGELAEVIYAVIGAKDAFNDLSDSVSGVTGPLEKAASAVSWVSPAKWEFWAAGKAMDYFADRGGEVADVTRDQTEAVQQAHQEQQRRIDMWQRDAEAEEKARAASAKLGDQIVASGRATKDATKAAKDHIAAVVAQTTADQNYAEMVQRQNDAMEDQAQVQRMVGASIAATRQQAVDLDEAMDTLVPQLTAMGAALEKAVKQAAFRELAKQAAEVVEQVDAIAGPVVGIVTDLKQRQIDSLSEVAAKQQEAAQTAADAWRAQQQEYVQAALDAGQIDQETADARMKQIDLQAEQYATTNDQKVKDDQARALKLWKQQQALAYANAGLHVAEAILMSLATTGPPVPPNFVGIAGMAAAIATGAAETIAISAAKPPAFPTGGAIDPQSGTNREGPDHVPVLAQPGEWMVNRRGVASAPPGALQDLNEGRGMSPTRVVVQLGRRTLADAVADVQGRTNMDPRMGCRDPYGRA